MLKCGRKNNPPSEPLILPSRRKIHPNVKSTGKTTTVSKVKTSSSVLYNVYIFVYTSVYVCLYIHRETTREEHHSCSEELNYKRALEQQKGSNMVLVIV